MSSSVVGLLASLARQLLVRQVLRSPQHPEVLRLELLPTLRLVLRAQAKLQPEPRGRPPQPARPTVVQLGPVPQHPTRERPLRPRPALEVAQAPHPHPRRQPTVRQQDSPPQELRVRSQWQQPDAPQQAQRQQRAQRQQAPREELPSLLLAMLPPQQWRAGTSMRRKPDTW
jgi:hypothetical protein